MSYHLCYQKDGELKYVHISAVSTEHRSQFENAVMQCENLERDGKLPKNKWCILREETLVYAMDSEYYKNNLADLVKLYFHQCIEKKTEENNLVISHRAQQFTLAGFAYAFLSFIKH